MTNSRSRNGIMHSHASHGWLPRQCLPWFLVRHVCRSGAAGERAGIDKPVIVVTWRCQGERGLDQRELLRPARRRVRASGSTLNIQAGTGHR